MTLLSLDSKIYQKYIVTDFIGSGSYGIVHKVKVLNQNTYMARKKIFFGMMSEKEKQHLIAEINVMRILSSSSNSFYFVLLHYWYINHRKKCIYLFMEYCQGGSLAQLISRRAHSKVPFAEPFIWIVTKQLVEALYFCHYGPIPFIHRDLKPENVLIDSSIKIGDFGMIKFISRSDHIAPFTLIGTLSYMAPEVFTHDNYDGRSDIWSLGCILYEMCTFKDPGMLRFKPSNQRINLNGYSPKLEAFIRSLLSILPWERPTSLDLLTTLMITSR